MSYQLKGILLALVLLGFAILGQSKIEKDNVARFVRNFSINISTINQTFHDIFLTPRNGRTSLTLKNKARNAIIQRHRRYGLEVALHHFEMGTKGVNIIATLPGKNRNRILVIGGHYDTVANTAGIADNASGSVLVLEAARHLSQLKGKLDHTILFVHFDFEEYGLLGSRAFVRDYLIGHEILDKKRTFLGAIIADMVLNYDPNPHSMIIPLNSAKEIPRAVKEIAEHNNKGDFFIVIYRKNLDNKVAHTIRQTWQSSHFATSRQKFRLVEFDVSLPAYAASRHRVASDFARSDHASFWYHGHPRFNQTLPAVELCDRGFWRGIKGRNCYHQPCDDTGWLTKDNLEFLEAALKTVIQVAKTYRKLGNGIRN